MGHRPKHKVSSTVFAREKLAWRKQRDPTVGRQRFVAVLTAGKMVRPIAPRARAPVRRGHQARSKGAFLSRLLIRRAHTRRASAPRAIWNGSAALPAAAPRIC